MCPTSWIISPCWAGKSDDASELFLPSCVLSEALQYSDAFCLLLFHFFSRSFSFDLMSQQGTEIKSTCCLVSSFLRRIFTCYFYIKKQFLTTCRKYHITLSSLLKCNFTFMVHFPGPEVPVGSCGFAQTWIFRPGWWLGIGTPAGHVSVTQRRPSLACRLLSTIGKDTPFPLSTLQLQFHFCKCKREETLQGHEELQRQRFFNWEFSILLLEDLFISSVSSPNPQGMWCLHQADAGAQGPLRAVGG